MKQRNPRCPKCGRDKINWDGKKICDSCQQAQDDRIKQLFGLGRRG